MTQTPDIWMLHTTNPREGESQWGGCYIVEADAHTDAATMRKVTGLDWTVVPMVRADSIGKCLHQIAEPAAAPQAAQADAPLPLLVRDIARDLGITVPEACIALKPLGNYSTNAAVTAEMARMLRDNFPAPAHPAEGVPAQAVVTVTVTEQSKDRQSVEFSWEPGALPVGEHKLYTHPTQQGLEQFIEQVGDVHFQRCRVGSKECEIRWDIEFGHYGAEVRGKTLRETITKAIAAQAKQGGV